MKPMAADPMDAGQQPPVPRDLKRVSVDDPLSAQYWADRFEISQSVYRTDPWAEHARPSERPAWLPLADLTLEAAE